MKLSSEFISLRFSCSPYDNKFAIQQIEDGHKSLLHREAYSPLGNDSITGKKLLPISLDGKNHPRLITLGGDHTIVLPLLRSIYSTYGPISVIHFDSHLGDSILPASFILSVSVIVDAVYQIHGSRPSSVALPLTRPLLTMERISIGPVRKG